jgi:hypothetical protein
MAKCQNCGGRVWGRPRDKLGVFCSITCRNNFINPGFCKSCIAATMPGSAGDNVTINGIGAMFYGKRDCCKICGSVVRSRWFCVLFIPLFPLGTFRVKYVAPSSYLSRKLPKEPRTREQVQSAAENLTQARPRPSSWCSQCGASVQANANFYHVCGARVQKS